MTEPTGPLRVWLMPSAYAPHRGGIETVTAELARELANRGHDVVVVTNRYPHELPEDEVVDGVRVVRVPWAARRRTPSGVARFVRDRRDARLAVSRLEPAPDVIHVHGVSSQADAARYAARHHGARLVVTTHGEVTADAHGLYEQSHARQALRDLLADADAVTAPSAWVVRENERVDLPLPAGHVVVRNGLDVDAWRRLPAAADGTMVALAWGRHSPEKGFDRLPPAWREVRAALPGAELWIAGTGPPGGFPSGGAQADDDGITHLAPAEPEEIHRLLARARVVVVPSRFEAFGLVALEALAAGRVVVYSEGTGMSETIGPYGIAADAEDPRALGAAIVAAFTEPPPPPPPPDHFHSWARMADDYLTLYRRVLLG